MKNKLKKFSALCLAVLLASSSVTTLVFGEVVDDGSIALSETGWGNTVTDAGTLDLTTEFTRAEADEANIRASEEGMVLLKNENKALPLTSDDTVAIFGSSQLWNGIYARFGFRQGGAGSGAVYAGPGTSLIEQFRLKAAAGKFSIYNPISELYEKYYLPDTELYPDNEGNYYNDGEYALAEDNGNYFPTDEEIAAAKAAGVNKVIYVFSRLEGEGGTEESFLPSNGEFEVTGVPDDKPEPGQYYLSENEENHLKKLRESFEQVIVIANTGDLIDTTWAKYGIDYDDNGEYTQVSDAVLFSWYGGLRGTQALTNVLVGDANPSGKLTETAAKSVDDYPSTDGFFESAYTNYYEDIFVGYRYFETFDPNYEKVNYEFGYGLSYTTFDISDITYAVDGDYIKVTAKVTNTGDVAGKEVVQVYFSAPQMGEGAAVLSKPAKELAGYVKTSELAAGGSETVTVSFPIKDMSSYDDTGVTGAKSAYVMEVGDYDILVGNSVKNVVKAGTYKVDEFTVVEQLTSKAAPYDLDKRLLADGTYEELETREKPEEVYNPIYGLPKYGNIKIEGESFDTVLSVGAPGSESFTAGTLIDEPVYLDENDSAGDFDYTTAAKSSYSGSHLCQMHRSVKQAVYAINVGEAGYYNIHIRGSGTELSDFLGLYINGENSGLTFNWPKTRGSGEYFAHADVYYNSSKTVYLPEGKNLIALENKKISFINLDFIEFIKTDTVVEKPPVSVTVQGEAYDTEKSVGVKTEDNKYTPQLATNIVWSSENVVDNANSTWVSYPGTCVSGIGAGDSIVYNITAPESGNYMLSMIACRPTSVVSDFFNIKVGDTLYEYDVPFPQTGGKEVYFKYIDYDFGGNVIVPLKKGDNTVTFEITGGGVLIDNLTFTKVTVPTVVEAEAYSADESTGTFKQEANWTSARVATNLVMTNPFVVDFENTTWEAYDSENPGTCVSGIEAGANLVYDVTVPEAGNYLFTMRACRPTNYHVNFMDIEVNGTRTVYAVNFPQTGVDEDAYFRYIDYSFDNKIVIPLNEGTNRITLIAKTTMPLIDKFTLTPTVLTPSKDIIVEGESYLSTSNGVGNENLSTSKGKYAISPVVADNVVDTDNTTWYNLSYAGAKNLSKLNDKTGYTAVYTVNASAAGTYGLIVRGAKSNAKTGAGWLSITVNGTTTTYSTTVFPQTGAAGVYFNFIDVDYSDVVKLELNEGENTVTFANVAGAPNVDFFKFKYIEPETTEAEVDYVREGDEAVEYETGVVTFADVKAGINTLDELIAQMTIQELASFTVLSEEPNYSAQRSGVGGNQDVQDKFGVPVATTIDGPAGPTTRANDIGFASGMTVACTWNIDIAADFGTIVGKVSKAHGSTDFWLAPGMNIQRNPLGGRNFEYFSEDPLITGLCGAAITDKVQRYGTAVAAKHFAVNNKETNRGANDSRVSERALREIYLRGFEIFVKDGRPIAMMTGYNLVNGFECCENSELLVDIPRNEWGFDGMYMTDWGKTPSLYKMVKGGCNTNMGNYKNMWDYNVLLEQYVAENLTRDDLEKNAAYILSAMLRLDIDDANSKSQAYTHTLSWIEATTVEAEEYSKAYKTVKIETREAASGGKNLGTFDTKDDDGNYLCFASFDVTVPQKTEYTVSISLSTFWAVNAAVFVDGEKVDLEIKNSSSTGAWDTFKAFEMGTLVLTQGNHVITVVPLKNTTASGEAFNFDCLTFTPVVTDNVSFSIILKREFEGDGMKVKYSANDYGNDTYDSGMRITLSNENGDTLYTLCEADGIYSADESGNTAVCYKIGLESGTYTALIQKNGYIAKEVEFTVTADNPAVSLETDLIAGDIKGDYKEFDGDGIVDIDDFVRVIRAFDKDAENSALRAVVDINEDGSVNVADLAFVKKSFGQKNAE